MNTGCVDKKSVTTKTAISHTLLYVSDFQYAIFHGYLPGLVWFGGADVAQQEFPGSNPGAAENVGQ